MTSIEFWNNYFSLNVIFDYSISVRHYFLYTNCAASHSQIFLKFAETQFNLIMEENTFPKTEPSVGQSALTYALIFAVAMIVVHLILFLFDAQQSTAGMIIFTVISLAGIAGIMYHFRGKCGGFISYGRAVKVGFVSVLLAGIIYAGYSYVYHTFINPEELQNTYIEKSGEALAEIDADDSIPSEQKANIKKMTAKYMSYGFIPWVVSVATLFMYAFFGIVASLIIAIFMKKQEPFPTFEESV